MTMQQAPHPFFSLRSSGGSCTLTGAGAGVGLNSVVVGVVGWGVGAMLGIVLYPPCSVPLVPGLLLVIDRGLPRGGVPCNGHADRTVVLVSDGRRSSGRGFSSGFVISSVFSSLNSRSYTVPVLPSFSHCSCAIRFACVGSICWSGGNRGSGLYIEAIHGGSPSGRWLVEGRGRPELVPGLFCGESRLA